MEPQELAAPTASGIVATLGRRWKVIGVTVAACLLLAIIANTAMPQAYTATATIAVAPLTIEPFRNTNPAQLVTMENERALVTSDAVCERAARNLDTRPAAADLRVALDVVIPPQSQVLGISATTPGREQSARWANAVAQAYLDDRAGYATQSGSRVSARLQTEIDARLRARATLTAAEKAMADRDVARLRGLQNELTLVGLNPGRVVSQATPPTSPSTLSTRVLLAGALAVGLLLGSFAALLRERMDPVVGSAQWIEENVGVRSHSATAESLDRQARRVLTILRAKGAWGDGRVFIFGVGGNRDGSLGDCVGEELSAGRLPTVEVHDVPLTKGDARAVMTGVAPPSAGDVIVLDVVAGASREDVLDVVESIRVFGSDIDMAVFREASTRAGGTNRVSKGVASG